MSTNEGAAATAAGEEAEMSPRSSSTDAEVVPADPTPSTAPAEAEIKSEGLFAPHVEYGPFR